MSIFKRRTNGEYKSPRKSSNPLPNPSPARPASLAWPSHAEHADDGHLVEFKALEVRSILNKSTSKRLRWLAWSINPYRGCEFGCKYCYARYTHEFMELRDPLAFERIIFLKQNAAWLLEQELRQIDPADEIALGTATDPYQPIERRARITRSLLEVFARRQGHHLGIVTKSPADRARHRPADRDRKTQHARRPHHHHHARYRAGAPARAARAPPRPPLRRPSGGCARPASRTGILCCPLLPGITDTQEALNEMARRAAAVDASFLAANPLFLKPCSRPTYLSFVREHFPSLQADYARRFDHADFAAPPYRQKLALMVEQACNRYGLNQRSNTTLETKNNTNIDLARKPPTRALPLQKELFGIRAP